MWSILYLLLPLTIIDGAGDAITGGEVATDRCFTDITCVAWEGAGDATKCMGGSVEGAGDAITCLGGLREGTGDAITCLDGLIEGTGVAISCMGELVDGTGDAATCMRGLIEGTGDAATCTGGEVMELLFTDVGWTWTGNSDIVMGSQTAADLPYKEDTVFSRTAADLPSTGSTLLSWIGPGDGMGVML